MKRILCIALLLIVIILPGCGISTADDIPKGVYLCETPYIKLTAGKSSLEGDEIEINGEIKKAYVYIVFDGYIQFCENGEILAEFRYNYDEKNEQLIFNDENSGNRYVLNKVE